MLTHAQPRTRTNKLKHTHTHWRGETAINETKEKTTTSRHDKHKTRNSQQKHTSDTLVKQARSPKKLISEENKPTRSPRSQHTTQEQEPTNWNKPPTYIGESTPLTPKPKPEDIKSTWPPYNSHITQDQTQQNRTSTHTSANRKKHQ